MSSSHPTFAGSPEGDCGSDTDVFFSVLYSELHRLARRELARQSARDTLGATTLLHEAYLDIAERTGASFPDQARFMGYAARVMRGLIIDHARSRKAAKRGGEFHITSLQPEMAETCLDARELSAVSDALDELGNVEPDLAEIVDLRFFCGFSFGEIAAVQQLSERTIQRKWDKARIYLRHNLHTDLSM